MANIPTLPDRSSGCKLHDIVLTHQDVLDQLNGLKTDKSCQLDNCHPRVLKEVKDGLILPLIIFFISFWKRLIYLPAGKKLSYCHL